MAQNTPNPNMEVLKEEKKNFWSDATNGSVSYLAQAVLAVVLMVKGQFLLGGLLIATPLLHILAMYLKHRVLKQVTTKTDDKNAVPKALSIWANLTNMITIVYVELALSVIQAIVAIYLMVAQKRYLLGSGVAALPAINIITLIVAKLTEKKKM